MSVGAASASRCNPVTKGILLFEWIPRHYFYQRLTGQASIRCVIVSSWLSHQWSKPSSSCAPKHLAFHMSSQHFAFSGLWAYTPPFASRRGVRSSSAWSRRRRSVALLIKEEAGCASHQGGSRLRFSSRRTPVALLSLRASQERAQVQLSRRSSPREVKGARKVGRLV